MESGNRLCFFLLLSLAPLMIGTARGYDIYVGGRGGWVAGPSESYGSWAGRLRFNVNDSLVFVYDNSVDSVLEVTSADYSACNAANPITKLDTGRDSFKLARSGPFYFITGNASHCQAGQKVIVVVLAVRTPPGLTPPPAPASAPPATAPAPGSSTPPATAPAPGSTTPAPAPASTAPTPAASPASAPSAAPASTAPTPASAPSATPASAPVLSPIPAPAALTPASASPPSPSGGASGSAPASEAAPGSSGSGSGSAGSPPPQTARSGSPASVPTSFPTILAAAALALFGAALLH